jgi:hypothetical protein
MRTAVPTAQQQSSSLLANLELQTKFGEGLVFSRAASAPNSVLTIS